MQNFTSLSLALPSLPLSSSLFSYPSFHTLPSPSLRSKPLNTARGSAFAGFGKDRTNQRKSNLVR